MWYNVWYLESTEVNLGITVSVINIIRVGSKHSAYNTPGANTADREEITEEML